MATLTQQQIQELKNKGLTEQRIAEIATQKGFELPKTPVWQKVLKTVAGFTTLGAFGTPNVPPKVAPIVGGIVGGITGGVPGAGVGTAVGETYKQVAEKISGEREKIEPAQIIGQGVIGALGEFGAVKVLAPIGVKILSKIPKEGIVKLLSKASGFTDEMVDRLLTRSNGVLEGYKEGESGLLHMVKTSAKKVQEFARESLEESKKLIAQFAKVESQEAKGIPKTTVNKIMLEVGDDFVNSMKNILRSEHNIGVMADGTLDFARKNQPSRIVSGGDKATVQEAYRLLNSVKNNTSIKNIDAIFERMFVLLKKTPVGSPTGTETKAIINQMISALEDFTQKVYPNYAQLIVENMEKRVGIQTLKEVFGTNPYPTGTEASKIVGRLYQIYNTGRLGVREQLEEAGTKIGQDVVGKTAGALLKEGQSYSFRAGQLAERGTINKLIDAIPRIVLENYVKTGNLTGNALQNQMLQRVIKIAGRTPIQAYLQSKTD